MADKLEIKENSELLKKIVAEKGFSGYNNRYYWILQEVINEKTVYEELSEENKAILHHVTGLDQEKIKVMSELVYGKPVPDDDADTTPETPQTKIGCVLALLSYRSKPSYRPLPEEKRLNPLEEYITLLSISLKMLMLQDDPARNRDIVFEFRYATKDYLHERYPYDGAFYNGQLPLFRGNVVVDLSLFDLAIRMDKTRDRLGGSISKFFQGHFFAINGYNEYRGPGHSCKDMEEFCAKYDYIDLTFPNRDIKTFLISDICNKSR